MKKFKTKICSIIDKNKLKKVLPIILLLLLITLVIGLTYAAFTLTEVGNENVITTGSISMSYTESTNVISIDNALPMSDVDGKVSSNYFDFSVTSNMSIGEDDPTTKINYSIEIEPLIEQFKQTFSYNENATEEQINSCVTTMLDYFALTDSEAKTFCSGGEMDGLTIQIIVDSANNGEDDYLESLYILEPSGVVNITHEWTVKKIPQETEINSCTLWWLNLDGITEEDEDYEEVYTLYSKLCSGKPVEEFNGLTLQIAIDYESFISSDYYPSLAQTGIIERQKVEVEDGYYALSENEIKIYLEDLTNNDVLVEPQLISKLSNYVLYNTGHTHKYNVNNVTTRYRLRAWIDYDTDASGWNEDVRYEYKFRVNITNNDDFEKLYEYVYYDEGTINREVEKQVRLINISYKYINDAKVIIDGKKYNYGDNGVFLYDGTDDNEGLYPIYYYRGNVTNNNVLFANMCWKIVRTTSTGGTKLIYNGVPDENGVCNNTGTSSQIGTSEFNSSYTSPAYVGYMYGERYESEILDLNWYSLTGKSATSQSINSSTTLGGGKIVIYSNGTYIITDYTSIPYSTYKNNPSLYEGYYMCEDYSSSCSTIRYIVLFGNTTFYNYVSMSNGETYDSLMKNEVVTKKAEIATYVYGNDVEYTNGTYTLKDTIQKSIITEKEEIANGHHYTCFNETGICSEVYYITYFEADTYIYYLTFTNGDDLESAKIKMTTNTTDSTIKTNIDSWYSENLTSYTNYLENTIFCNDRSSASGTLGGPLASKDTNSTDGYSYFISYENVINGTPNLQCSNINDRFSLSTDRGGTSEYGNNALAYPVGLLTLDEVVLTGLQNSSNDTNNYLNTGQWFWLLSPSVWTGAIAGSGAVRYLSIDGLWLNFTFVGVRPSISLKLGTTFQEGTTGTSDNPYIVVTQ